MKIVLDVQLSSFGINIDVQPEFCLICTAMNWYISVDIPESAPMVSGGHFGHGGMVRMP